MVGKPWRDWPVSKYPEMTIPVNLPGGKNLAWRYYQPEMGKSIVTMVEVVGALDRKADIVLAVLDLQKIMEPSEAANSDCEVDGHPDPSTLIVGLIPSGGSDKSYKPRRAWKITAKKMKFTEIQAAPVTCTPEKFSY